ncbi:hypothetical protein C8R43DRAFT_1124767 [Mycena crocata]|nr:hypothetical protein C8R43DRAFT_1124767 [Mycena crocata]
MYTSCKRWRGSLAITNGALRRPGGKVVFIIMAPIPPLLTACICILGCLGPTNTYLTMNPDKDGTLKFRTSRVVDVSVGFDDADPLGNVSADKVVYISNDGMQRADELLNIGQKKRHINPTTLKDAFANWVPVDDKDAIDDAALDNMDKVSGADPKKRYESSDDPMAQWRSKKQFFLDETLRQDGLGDSMHKPECALCHQAVGPDAPVAARFFRCRDCGDFLQCKSAVSLAISVPLSMLNGWGHFGNGGPCPNPEALMRTMVVINMTGIHSMHFHYCACDRRVRANELQQLMRCGWYPASITDPGTCATFNVLDLFRLLNVVGNLNVHDFIQSLERRTDGLCASGMRWMPDRYRAFSRMQCQNAFLDRVRRTGRAHDNEGVDKTSLGETLPVCWACPQEWRNLPPDWQEVDPKYRFLYMLLVALDANLKNRLRANECHDPPLGPGWGAFVEPEEYPLLQKDTRLTTGLRTSGVGGCVCACHECVRPNGIGDLQKGERYANMDYIAMSGLVGVSLMLLTISYDIACQWKKNLPARNAKLPERIQLDLDKTHVQCGLPVWHASSHETECSNENSLGFLVGVGKTDGEGVERTWADLNPASYHTKEMGAGNRADSLDDKIDSHNFLKNITQVSALRRKLIVALAERLRQVASFREVNKTVSRELRASWQAAVDVFVADHSAPNPYILKDSGGLSEPQIRLNLRLAEEEEARKTGAPLHGTSATALSVELILSKNGAKILRVKLAISPIPLFWVDVPSSSHSVRFTSEFTGPEPDDHIEPAEVLGPSDLATSEYLRSRKAFEVLVVRDNVDQKRQSFEVMSPDSKGVEDRKQLLVVRVVIEFGRTECPGPEHNWVNFAVVAEDRENGGDGVVGSVGFDCDLSTRNPVRKHRSFRKSALECFESRLTFV